MRAFATSSAMFNPVAIRLVVNVLVWAAVSGQALGLEFSFAPVIDSTALLPGSDASIDRINYLAFDGELVAFTATSGTGRGGVYTAGDGLFDIVADTSSPYPPDPSSFFQSFSGVSIDNGSVAFGGKVSSREGVFTNIDGPLRSVIHGNTAMPGTSGSFSLILTGSQRARFAIDGEKIVVSAAGPRINGNRVEGVYVDTGGALEVIADFRTPHPEPGRTFSVFDHVDIDNGEVVFRAGSSDFLSDGVYTTLAAAPGEIRTVVNRQTLLNGLGTPVRIDPGMWPQIEGDEIITQAIYDPTFTMGIYREAEGEVRGLIDPFDANPIDFTSFGELSLFQSFDQGSVAFQSLDRDVGGVYLYREGRVHPVLLDGQPLDGKTPSRVILFPESLAGEKLALYAEFEDGSFGIYEAFGERPEQETFPVFPTFDIQAVLEDPPQLFEGDDRVSVSRPLTLPETQALLDFSLEQVPADATIESAVLELTVRGSVGLPEIEALGYAGNGIPEFVDLTNSSTSIGLSGPIDFFAGPTRIDLDPAYVQSLIGSGSELGVVLKSVNGNFLLFSASDSLSEAAPALLLTVSYANESLTGDFNRDGFVNAIDYTVWRDGAGGDFSTEDYDTWAANYGDFEGRPVIAGDFNGDGLVNAVDYSVWRDSVGSETNLSADANGDGSVDLNDYAIWRTQYGQIIEANVIPEPGSLAVVAIGCFLIRLTARSPQVAPRRVQ